MAVLAANVPSRVTKISTASPTRTSAGTTRIWLPASGAANASISRNRSLMNIGRRSQARPFRALAIYALSSFLVLILDCSKARESGADHEPPPPKVPQTLEAAPTRVPLPDPIVRDLPVIQEGATLKVLFTFNSTGYFIYRGETMGYEYELLRTFARESGLNIESVVVRDSKTLFDKLNRGEGDLVAAQLVETPNESEVLQTAALYDTKPMVVQRKGDHPAAGLPVEVSTAIARE